VPRKKVASRLPMESVVKAAEAVPHPNQLMLDFEGRAAAKQKTTTRAKTPRVRKVPTGIDIPEKPKS
jgi:hypothetical protein